MNLPSFKEVTFSVIDSEGSGNIKGPKLNSLSINPSLKLELVFSSKLVDETKLFPLNRSELFEAILTTKPFSSIRSKIYQSMLFGNFPPV